MISDIHRNTCNKIITVDMSYITQITSAVTKYMLKDEQCEDCELIMTKYGQMIYSEVRTVQ